MQTYSQSELYSLFSLKPPKQPKPLSAVYVIHCKVTQRSYVGSAQLNDKSNCPRLTGYHKSQLQNGKHPSKLMQSDFNQYPDSFMFTIVETCKTSEARQREQGVMLRIESKGFKLYNTNRAFTKY